MVTPKLKRAVEQLLAECDRALMEKDLHMVVEKLEVAQQLLDGVEDELGADVLLKLGHSYRMVGRMLEAKSALLKASYLFDFLESPAGRNKSDFELAVVLRRLGEYSAAEETALRARAYRVEVQDWDGVAASDQNLGVLYAKLGNYEAAEHNYLAARSYRASKEEWDKVSISDLNLGVLYRRLGDYARAKRFLRAARKYRSSRGDKVGVLSCDYNLALVYLEEGNLDRAEATLKEVRTLRKHLKYSVGVTDCDVSLARIAILRRQFETAMPLLEKVRAEREKRKVPEAVAWTEMLLAEALWELGRVDEARLKIEKAKEFYREQKIWVRVASCDIKLGALLVAGWKATSDHDLDRGPLKEAARVLLPAALFLDAGRFSIPSFYGRRLWLENIAGPANRLAFSLAYELGDPELVKQLIADARSTGIYRLSGGERQNEYDKVRFDSQLIAEAMRVADHVLNDGDTEGNEKGFGPASTLSGAQSRLIGVEGYRLAPSPLTRMPDGQIALASYLAEAIRRYQPAGAAQLFSIRSGTVVG